MRTTFLVGRLTARGAEIVVAESSRAPAPIPGPWTLRALVRLVRCRIEAGGPSSMTVH